MMKKPACSRNGWRHFRHGALSLLLLPLGCQLVFGDFRVDTRELYPALENTTCEFGELRCEEGALTVCASDRTSTNQIVQCSTPEQCNLNAQGCQPCKEGERQCNGAFLEVCGTDGKFQRTACESAALCRASGCLSPVCKAGEHRCNGGRLERCAPGRDGWQLLSVCASATQCDAARADAQSIAGMPATCASPVCRANQFRCDGPQPQACKATLDAWENKGAACAPGTTCNPADGTCTPCKPGTQTCSGKDLLNCTAEGRFELQESCGSVELCRGGASKSSCLTSGKCDVPGQVTCDAGIIQRCAEGLVWETLVTCLSPAYCAEGRIRCGAPACGPNGFRCMGNTLLKCNGDGSSLELVQACDAGLQCDSTVGTCALPCTNGSQRCNDRFFETCEQQTWKVTADCGSAALCRTSGTPGCLAPVCGGDLPEFSCANDQPQQCKPGRDGFVAKGRPCTSDERCDSVLGRCTPL
ncbi:MAG TPA: hypothetical protein VFQ61_08460 [Polyangiaceae bacterium]|nr:hypothetical protein [Polyangiaceae bacterium]